MTSLRILLALLLLQNIAMGQACVVNSTEPPPLYSAGTPVAWPKTNLYQAPTYAGHVEYYINCTYIVSPDGTYWSCPSPSLQNDISTAADNWNSAATSNGSTVNLRGVNVPPTSDGSCGPPPCFPTYTPWNAVPKRDQRHKANSSLRGANRRRRPTPASSGCGAARDESHPGVGATARQTESTAVL